MERVTVFWSAKYKHFHLAELVNSIETPVPNLQTGNKTLNYLYITMEDYTIQIKNPVSTYLVAAPAAPASVRKQ